VSDAERAQHLEELIDLVLGARQLQGERGVREGEDARFGLALKALELLAGLAARHPHGDQAQLALEVPRALQLEDLVHAHQLV
jgi:hypothetical protein